MPNTRRYSIELAATMVIYGLLLVGTNRIVQAGWVPEEWLIPTALVPMLPCLAALWVIIRHIRQMDEFQRQLQFEALAFSFAGTALLTFTYGFLEGAGLPKLSMFVVWPLMGALWVVGRFLACRRYR